MEVFGGTLCSDGAKNFKRSCLNSILQTKIGNIFAQSTNANGMYKTAEMLRDDNVAAIKYLGEKYVKILCMDGACKKAMKLTQEVYPKLFIQRCSTHGCNLLLRDIGKLFEEEITISVRLVKFISNHDSVFSILNEKEGALQLFASCDVRFASQLYSTEVSLIFLR